MQSVMTQKEDIIELMKLPRKFLVTLTTVAALSACSFLHRDIENKKSADEFNSESPLAIETLDGAYYIAIAAPLTGPYRELGRTIVEGVNLAVEDFNKTQDAAHKIGTVVLDDGGLVAEGLGRADIAIAQKALGVIGHLNSEISVEASRKYSAAKIPQISPASTHPKFTDRPEVKGYVFRTIGTDKQLGERAAAYVSAQQKLKKIAVMYNDRAYGISVASEFVRNLAKDQSKQLIFYETIPVRTSDHSQTVSRLDELNPDLVFFVGEYNDAGYLLKALKEKEPKVAFLSVEGTHNNKFIDIAGKAAEGALIISTSIPSTLAKAYREHYDSEVSGYVGSSYLAAKTLLEAAKANGYKSGAGLSAKLQNSGVFLANGDLKNPNFVFYKVTNGKFVQQP